MKLFINGRFLSQRITGVQRMAREFTRALDALLVAGVEHDLDVCLLVPEKVEFGDLVLDAIEVRTVTGASGHVWEQLRLPGHARGGILLNLGNTMPLLSLFGSGRVAIVLHDLSYRLHPDAYRLGYQLSHKFMNAALLGRADLIVTVAESERATIRRLYPAIDDHIVVAQNGSWAGDDLSPAPRGQRAEEPYGLYVGSLSRRKNVQGVLQAAIRLARERGLRFKLVGATSLILTGIDMEVPGDVRHLIEFCGQIENNDALKTLYQGAAFLLFPSFYEASALPPMEAMAQQCPVIVSDIPSLRERCGGAALYCDPGDPGSIDAAVRRALDDHDIMGRMIQSGVERAQHFTWRSQAQTIIAALRDLP